jgi:hypothetical protein
VIYVVGAFSEYASGMSFSTRALRFADSLAKAGFHVALTPRVGDVPADAPRIENVSERYTPSTACPASSGVRLLLLVVSFGVVPLHDCEEFGSEFDFRRSAESPIRHIDTRYAITSIVGWVAIPLKASPGYSGGLPAEVAEGERRRLRTALLDALAETPTN